MKYIPQAELEVVAFVLYRVIYEYELCSCVERGESRLDLSIL
jgi:hypothetical protein